MAGNSTGKWVKRAASTGGGSTYRGQMPVNWYASLVLICLVGLFLVAYSRYELVHPQVVSSGPPTTQQVWYAAEGVDVCGKIEPNLPAGPSGPRVGFTTDGSGVITIAPKNSSQSGGNATLGTFVAEYKKLGLTTTSLRYPGAATMSNGEVCPKGTPDAGKQGFVTVENWPSFAVKKGVAVSGDPLDLKFSNGQLIEMAFLPVTKTVPKPPALAITKLLQAESGSGTTTPTPTSGSGTTPTSGSGTTPTPTSGSGTTPTPTSGSGTTPTPTSGSGTTPTSAAKPS